MSSFEAEHQKNAKLNPKSVAGGYVAPPAKKALI
jgi:hypothetical protein